MQPQPFGTQALRHAPLRQRGQIAEPPYAPAIQSFLHFRSGLQQGQRQATQKFSFISVRDYTYARKPARRVHRRIQIRGYGNAGRAGLEPALGGATHQGRCDLLRQAIDMLQSVRIERHCIGGGALHPG